MECSEKHEPKSIVTGLNIPTAKFKCDSDGFLHFRFKTIISPDEFYIAPCDPDYANPGDSEEQTFRQLTEEMSQFYCQHQNQCPVDLSKLHFGAAQLNMPYDDEAGMFYRCLVTKATVRQTTENCRSNRNDIIGTTQNLKVNVFYIDLGLTERSKPASEVFLLDKRFCKIPTRVMNCSLFATRPVEEGRRTKFGVWPSEAIATFKKLCRLGQIMKATILIEESDRYGVVLYDVDSPCAPIVINNELTKLGVAKSDIAWLSFLEKNLHILQRRHPRPVVSDPITNMDVEQLFNDSPGPSAVSNGFVCRQQMDSLDLACIEPPEKNSVVEVSLGCLTSCVQFWLYFLSGTEDVRKTKLDPQLKAKSMKHRVAFDDLTRQINDPKFLSRLPRIKPHMSVGDFCLALFSQDGLLYRAKVTNCFPDDAQYKVTYIDYGNSEYVSAEHVYPISFKHLQVPIMALECHLANVKPTTEACLEENRNILVEKISSKPLKARIVDVIERSSNYPLLMIELRAIDVDNSFISINNFVVEQGWAILV